MDTGEGMDMKLCVIIWLCLIGVNSLSKEPCPDGFVLSKDTCYALGSSGSLAWQEAQTNCQQYAGGHLASVHDTEQMDFIASLNVTSSEFVWIGGTLDDNNNFIWSDLSSVDTNTDLDFNLMERHCLYLNKTTCTPPACTNVTNVIEIGSDLCSENHPYLCSAPSGHRVITTEGNGNVTFFHDHNLTLQYSDHLVFIVENCNSSTINFYDISNNFVFNLTFMYTNYCKVDIVINNTNSSYTVGNETVPIIWSPTLEIWLTWHNKRLTIGQGIYMGSSKLASFNETVLDITTLGIASEIPMKYNIIKTSSLEDSICFKWMKPKHGPRARASRSTLTDGLISSCEPLMYPRRFLYYHAKINIPVRCLNTESKFSVRISVNQFSSCQNVTFLQTGVKPNSGTSDSESCSENNRLLECSLMRDYTRMNTYCEYECTCILKSSSNRCKLYVNLHPNSPEKYGELCEIVFI